MDLQGLPVLLDNSRLEIRDLDFFATFVFDLMQKHRVSWPDRDFQNAFAARAEEFVRLDDLIELETVREQR